MIYTIYIPSKQRPEGKTFGHLEAVQANKVLVIEKEDINAYRKHAHLFNEIVILPESDQGMPYVRNFIKDHATAVKLDWFWCMDDDIDSFHKAEAGKKMRKIQMTEALRSGQDIIVGLKAALGALNYAQYAFTKTKPYTLNKRCLVCTLNNVEALKPMAYDPKVILKSDIDFTLQILKAGLRTALCEQVAFKIPVYGTNKGGLQSTYKIPGIEKMCALYLEEKWGKGMIRAYVKDTGRWDVKINWDLFK